MPLDVQHNVQLKPFNTLSLPARAEHFVCVERIEHVQQAATLAADKGWPITLLGAGSNVVLSQDLPGLVLQIAIKGIELLSESDDGVTVRVGAGENWHQLVQKTLANGWYGLENLSLIPGTAGAAPVQNIGAYGVEVADYLVSVELVDLATGEQRTLDRDACQFGYRESIFKSELRGRVAITAITLKLPTQPTLKLTYPALKKALQDHEPAEITPQQVSELVCQIRNSKLPDPASLPNAGSFFKNPVVPTEIAHDLCERFPNLVVFPAQSGFLKLAAGWLIEQAGWKGRRCGDVGVHEQQALVLVNSGEGTGAELLSMAAEITRSVEQMFGVTLEMEPRVLPE